MRVTTNEKYRAGHFWVHKLFEHVQNFRTNLPKLHRREEHCSNWLSLSLSLLEWPRMTRNDHSNKLELSIRPHSEVDSAQWDLGIMSNGQIIWTTQFITQSSGQPLNKTFITCSIISVRKYGVYLKLLGTSFIGMKVWRLSTLLLVIQYVWHIADIHLVKLTKFWQDMCLKWQLGEKLICWITIGRHTFSARLLKRFISNYSDSQMKSDK